LPELIANSPVPGVREPLTTLKSELKNETSAKIELEAALPTALHGPGQTRLLIGSEIILVEATSSTTVTVLERAAEGSTKAAHLAGSSVYQILTHEGLRLYAITTYKTPVAYGTIAVLNGEPEWPTAETVLSKKEEKLKVDGAEPAVGERILVQNEAETKHNGIYEVIKAGKAGEKWELKRTIDANTTLTLQDAQVTVEKGTVNTGKSFLQTAIVTTVGTSSQTWVANGPYTGKSPIKVTGSEIELEKEKVTAEFLGPLAVTQTKIGSEAVSEGKIANAAVTSVKIKNEAVTTEKLGITSVGTNQLKNLSVTEATISTGAVVTAKLQLPVILPAKGAAGSVTLAPESAPARKITAVLVGKTAQTEFTIKHNLKSKAVIVSVAEGEAEPEDLLTGYKIKVKTENEIAVIFNVAPAEGTYILVSIVA
jgi:hypothetical protein